MPTLLWKGFDCAGQVVNDQPQFTPNGSPISYPIQLSPENRNGLESERIGWRAACSGIEKFTPRVKTCRFDVRSLGS